MGIVGCGLIGNKRAAALGEDELVGCMDVRAELAEALAERCGGDACGSLAELLSTQPDVVIVATTHDQLASLAVTALDAGAHVLVEKPAGISVADVDRIAAAAGAADRRPLQAGAPQRRAGRQARGGGRWRVPLDLRAAPG